MQGHCHQPTTSKFASATVPTCPNPGTVILTDTSGTTIEWIGQKDTCGEYFDENINMGADFVSLNVDNLNQALDSKADVILAGIDCSTEGFDLYFADGFFTTR